MIEGVWASDRSAGVMRQVRRCKAEQDDGMINPATPLLQRERERKLSHSSRGEVTVQHKVEKYTQVTDSLFHRTACLWPSV